MLGPLLSPLSSGCCFRVALVAVSIRISLRPEHVKWDDVPGVKRGTLGFFFYYLINSLRSDWVGGLAERAGASNLRTCFSLMS